MIGVTAKQRELLDFVLWFNAEHRASPSYAEIASAIGLKSKSGVYRMVAELQQRGHIRRRPNHANSLEVISEAPCAHCGHPIRSAACRAAADRIISYSNTPASALQRKADSTASDPGHTPDAGGGSIPAPRNHPPGRPDAGIPLTDRQRNSPVGEGVGVT